MRQYILVFFMSLLFINTVKSQEIIDCNLIIIINEEIEPNSISIRLKYTLKNGTIRDVDTKYLQGSLKINKESFDELKNDSVEKVTFEIRNTTICKEKIDYSFFNIEDINFKLLTYDYLILKIYNTGLKRYKKIYDPISGKNFTYEYDSPNSSMRRVQKKFTKKQLSCQ